MKYLMMIIMVLGGMINTKAQCVDSLTLPNFQPPCFADFMPVCGCDGITYRNACYANYASVLLYEDSPCEQIVLDIYPNPCTYWLYPTIVTRVESNVNLYIFDRNGNVAYYRYLSNVTNTTLTIPINDFNRGLYIIMVESNGYQQLSKFIKWDE